MDMDLFNPPARPDPARVAQLKQWIAGRWGLASGAVILVSELRCPEPGCPPTETVIAVLDSPGVRRQAKIHKPVAEIEERDLAELRFRAG